jgi:hypothetical protein
MGISNATKIFVDPAGTIQLPVAREHASCRAVQLHCREQDLRGFELRRINGASSKSRAADTASFLGLAMQFMTTGVDRPRISPAEHAAEPNYP